MGEVFIEQLSDGEWQWIRHRDATANGLPLGFEDIPKIEDIERLLELYVATGEGLGAYIAAKEVETPIPLMIPTFPRYPPPPRPSRPYSGSSGDDDWYSGGGKPPTRPPSGYPPGGRPTGPPPKPQVSSGSDSDNDDRYGASGISASRPPIGRPSATYVAHETHEIHVVRPQAAYDRPAIVPIFAEAPLGDNPIPIPPVAVLGTEEAPAERMRMRRRTRLHPPPPHEETDDEEPLYAPMPSEEDDYRVQSHSNSRRSRAEHPRQSRTSEVKILPTERPPLNSRNTASQRRRPGIIIQNVHRPEEPRHQRMSHSHRQGTSDNRRASERQQQREPELRERETGMRFRERARDRRRASEILQDESDMESPEPRIVRDRGGAAGGFAPLTKSSAIDAGLHSHAPRGTTSGTNAKRIVLYFYYTNRGQIMSSRKPELYTTFQELRKNQPATDRAQLSDKWLVDKLHEHYSRINRKRHGLLWGIVYMKTMGFATFLRFERTVSRDDDANGYTVTAKVPAISTEGEAISQFRHTLKYPPPSAKMMLASLDRLAGQTSLRQDRRCYYVVEIKETIDTRKVFALLILFILISTAGGTAYAIVLQDTSSGMAVATYVLTCLALILSFLAAGEWVGLSKPSSFSFAYNMTTNRALSPMEFKDITSGHQANRRI